MAPLIRPARPAPTPPTATYRLQLQPGFPFAAAEAVVPHLAALGVSHLHLSPVLQAVPGSTHGYDVVDHTLVREELGGEAGLRALSRTAREHGLGLVLDIVPNHMAVPAPEYLARPLWSVLREGPESPYSGWFDIDWQACDGKLLLPVLGGPPADVQREGALELGKHEGEPVLRYYEHAFPLRPGTERLPLPELLDAQWYRLAWWRQARTDINYRRFFTISELIAVRVEDPEVFAATHATLLRLLRDGVADGLRIDHPDGLADPAGYLRRLSEACGGRWTVVEKILTGDERLPDSWSCAGTTGYDALDHIDGLFTDPAGVARITEFYREFTGRPGDLGGVWEATARRAARRIVTHDLAAEVDRLARAARTAGTAVSGEAIREVLVRIPVYRPYVLPGVPAPQESAARVTAAARDAAVPGADTVRDLALGRLGRGPGKDDFAIRFAQVSSALRAKSVEDTAFYRYVPLLSLNEVGRDPARPAVPPAVFHAFCARLQRDWPTTGTVLSTHDTKRGADVRARLTALSEVPDLWAGSVPRDTEDPRSAYQAWQYTVVFGARPAPDGGTAAQAEAATGAGAEAAADLIAATLLKSEREAGLRTSWTEQDPVYEGELETLTREVVSRPTDSIAHAIEHPALTNILGAVLVHLTMPGVPDIYQGDEDHQLLLVDPANRAPYTPRPATPGSPKRLVTTTALRLRRDRPEWFGADAGYEPLFARGPAADHCLAFVRTGRAITVVTRLSLRLREAGGWCGTVLPLPEGEWQDLLTDRPFCGAVRLDWLLDRYPVALLAPAPS